MELFVSGCRRIYGKGMKIEMNKAFWMIVKNATSLACINPLTHKRQKTGFALCENASL